MIRRTDSFKLGLPGDRESKFGVSVTVPDEAMSLKEIVSRHMRGSRIDQTLYREGSYPDDANFDDDDLEELSRMDVQEKREVAERIKQDVVEKQEILKNAAAKAKAKNERESAGSHEQNPPEAGEAPDDEGGRSADSAGKGSANRVRQKPALDSRKGGVENSTTLT